MDSNLIVMKSNTSLKHKELRNYVSRQLQHFFPDNDSSDLVSMDLVDEALERTIICFSVINSPIYQDNDMIKFNHLHGDQYASFLYFLSRVAYEKGEDDVYYKSALLNKSLNGLDLFGHVKMPDHFLLVHPLGTIIGRAKLGDNLVIYQGVTIGGKHREDGEIDYPSLGENCVLYANSTVLGKTHLPANTVVGANTFLANYSLNESGKMLVGRLPEYRTLNNKGMKFFLKHKK